MSQICSPSGAVLYDNVDIYLMAELSMGPKKTFQIHEYSIMTIHLYYLPAVNARIC